MYNRSCKALKFCIVFVLLSLRLIGSAMKTAPPLCGNGTIDPGETCDLGKGKNTGEFGCNSECTDESGWTCVTGSSQFDDKIKEMNIMYKNLCTIPYVNSECNSSTQLAQEKAINKCYEYAYYKEFLAFKAININNPVECADECKLLKLPPALYVNNTEQDYTINCGTQLPTSTEELINQTDTVSSGR